MNIHEYQAKELLSQYDIPLLKGIPLFKVEDAEKAAEKLGGAVWVVKAQILAGGRGKGHFIGAKGETPEGGVRVMTSLSEVAQNAKEMLGNTLVTHQTGPKGQKVNQLYLEQGVDIASEFYLSLVVNRSSSKVAFVVSTEGGVSIEDVAKEHPENIVNFSIDPIVGVQEFHVKRVGKLLSLSGVPYGELRNLMKQLYKAFCECDMALLEINPLVLTKDNHLKCLDAKISFDDNALYRHKEIAALRDVYEEDPKELEATQNGLSYIALDGTIGCMVNGAGLAMATLDIIKYYGAEPANFLDVGGGATEDKVALAFKIITSEPRVKGILVNIFGGIMRCDVIARGIVAAIKGASLTVPLVVRLEGTNAKEGQDYLDQSGLNVVSAQDLDDAAKKIVDAVKRV